MKKISLLLWAIVLSAIISGTASALDVPSLSPWMQSMGVGGGIPGVGDLLLAPLYDVRGLKNQDTGEGLTFQTSQQTLISIVNQDNQYGAIVRLRFREWKRGREVLSLDVPLSSNDVWVAEVSRLPGGGAVIHSPDQYIGSTPTSDYFVSSPFPSEGIAFDTSGILDGAAEEKLSRTEYGFFEVIGAESVCGTTANGPWSRLCLTDKDVKNTLMGQVYLIRPEGAISHQYNMNAYSNFSADVNGIWEAIPTGRPNLLSGVQGEGNNPGGGGFNQLEAILSAREVTFQYVNGIDSLTNTPMNTSVVISFPTKHFHYDSEYHRIVGFWQPFTGYHETPADGPSGGEVIETRIFDRNGNQVVPWQCCCILCPPPPPPDLLPWEVNIIGLLPMDPLPDPFATDWRDNVLIATANIVTGQISKSGWGAINLSPEPSGNEAISKGRLDPVYGSLVPQGKADVSFNFFNYQFPGFKGLPGAYRGLPVIGIVVTEFFNNSINGYYGNTVPWQSKQAFGEIPVFP